MQERCHRFCFSGNNNRILVSWRLLDTDNKGITFDLYRTADGSSETKLNNAPINNTCYQDNTADHNVSNTLSADSKRTKRDIGQTHYHSRTSLKRIAIYLHTTTNTSDISSTYEYKANDASIGDLDGDGKYEIILKRLIAATSNNESNNDDSDDTGTVIENATCHVIGSLSSGWHFLVAHENGTQHSNRERRFIRRLRFRWRRTL